MCASLVFLLALPLAALCQLALGTGGGVAIHGALALGSALMSFAVFDFKTPRWATWMGSMSLGALAVVFLLQGTSDLVHDESLAYLAYRLVGQRLEGWLVDLFMAWCVVVLVADRTTLKIPGIAALVTVACVEAYGYFLAHHGTSLDARAPILKVLWLAPFVWILLESTRGVESRPEMAT